MEKSNSTQLVPYIRIEYFEFEKRIEKAVEFCSNSIIIDGFFFPTGSNRLSLGYQISLNYIPGIHIFLIEGSEM